MQVFATYFHYFRGEHNGFSQWKNDSKGKNPKNRRKGGEKWRRDIWVGEPGAYPSIGPYHSGDPGVVRWHIRSAKAAGISAFLLFINRWKEESGLTDRLLNLAHEEGFKIGFIEHHGSLGIRSMREIDPESHSAASRNVPPAEVNAAIGRITAMMKRWQSHPAYLRINGKPMVVIPYMVQSILPSEFHHLVAMVKQGVGEDLYITAIVPAVYWYMFPESIIEKNSSTKITREWADAGVDCFTHWTPNGMVTLDQNTRNAVNRAVVADSRKWRKQSMIPVMPGFNDDAWRPGEAQAKTSPRGDGRSWREQIISARRAKPDFLFIQSWNEWHEGSQIEPSVSYSEPYLYLKTLAGSLGKSWNQPTDPPLTSIDSWMRPFFPLSGQASAKYQGKTLVFQAKTLSHQIGYPEGSGWSASTARDPKGFLCYGPYTTAVASGLHRALFRMMIDNNTADNSKIVRLDVRDVQSNKLLGKRDVRRRDFQTSGRFQDFEIQFECPVMHALEFRIFWHRRAWVNVQKVTVI